MKPALLLLALFALVACSGSDPTEPRADVRIDGGGTNRLTPTPTPKPCIVSPWTDCGNPSPWHTPGAGPTPTRNPGNWPTPIGGYPPKQTPPWELPLTPTPEVKP